MKIGEYTIGFTAGLLIGIVVTYYCLHDRLITEQKEYKSTTQEKIDSLDNEIMNLKLLKTKKIYEQMLKDEQLN